MDFYIVPSLTDKDVYFIFREFAEEVRFVIEKGLIKPERKLTADEANYIRENYITGKPKRDIEHEAV